MFPKHPREIIVYASGLFFLVSSMLISHCPLRMHCVLEIIIKNQIRCKRQMILPSRVVLRPKESVATIQLCLFLTFLLKCLLIPRGDTSWLEATAPSNTPATVTQSHMESPPPISLADFCLLYLSISLCHMFPKMYQCMCNTYIILQFQTVVSHLCCDSIQLLLLFTRSLFV